MKLRGLMVVVFLGCLLGYTDDALAWGPATHIGLGNTILDQLGLLPAALAAILARHRNAYLYGNIAADIVFAKRLSRVKQFCHHWSTAFRLLESARDDRAKAFSWGYLSHLAADTVAHGKYVPRQVVMSGFGINLGHFYWELRADAAEPNPSWRLLEQVLEEDHTSYHTSLADHITDTFLSYELNRLLFDGIQAVTVRKGFRNTLRMVSECSRWPLSATLLEGYHGECIERIHSILCEGDCSALLGEDPNGTSALMSIHVRRREVRRLKRRGIPTERRLLESSATLIPSPQAGHSSAPSTKLATTG